MKTGSWVGPGIANRAYTNRWDIHIHNRNYLLVIGLFLLFTMGACSGPAEATKLSPTPSMADLPQPVQYDTLEQVQEHTSFPLLAPQTGQLPQGLELVSVEYWTQEQDPSEVIVAGYSAEGADLTITETLTPQGIAAPRGLTYQNIRVRGQDGYLLTTEGQPDAYALIWEENGIMLTLSSSGLTMEELFKIADGLKPLR